MNKVNRGVELGLNYKINNNWNIDLAGTIAEYYYSNNPDGSISYENGKEKNIEEKVYLNNYYVGGTPQVGGTFGLNYFYDYWFISANLNGFGRNYIEISPLRRLASNYTGINPNDEVSMAAYRTLVDQECLDGGYTLDFSIGKVLYLPGSKAINLNFSFNNITNRKDIRTGGYEQGRLDITAPLKFASKYYYMQGINCFLNMSYRF
jgi:outer membrane receptor protein involved in Fe transport